MGPHNRLVCKCIVQVDKSLSAKGNLVWWHVSRLHHNYCGFVSGAISPIFFRKWWAKWRYWLKTSLIWSDEWRRIGMNESNFTSQVLFSKLSAKILPSSKDKWYCTNNCSCKIQSRTISLFVEPLHDSSIFWTFSKHSWHVNRLVQQSDCRIAGNDKTDHSMEDQSDNRSRETVRVDRGKFFLQALHWIASSTEWVVGATIEATEM